MCLKTNESASNQQSKQELEIEQYESRIGEYTTKLRSLISNNPTINNRLDDEYLARFLRAAKYDINNAENRVLKWWGFRAGLKSPIYPTRYKGFIEKICTVFKFRNEGRHVILVRFGEWDPSVHSTDEILAAFINVLDQMVASLNTQIYGLDIIVDLDGFCLTHVRHLSPKALHQMISLLQGGYPARFKSFHLINSPAIFNIVLTIAKPLFKEKLRKRIIFQGYKYQDNLRKAIGEEVLPVFLGGNVPDDSYEDSEIFQLMYARDLTYKKLWSKDGMNESSRNVNNNLINIS